MAQCSRYFPPRTLKLPFGPASQRFCCLTSPMGTPGPALPFSLGWAGALTSSAVAPFCVSVSPSCSSGGFHQPLFHGLETRFKEPRRPLQQKKKCLIHTIQFALTKCPISCLVIPCQAGAGLVRESSALTRLSRRPARPVVSSHPTDSTMVANGLPLQIFANFSSTRPILPFEYFLFLVSHFLLFWFPLSCDLGGLHLPFGVVTRALRLTPTWPTPTSWPSKFPHLPHVAAAFIGQRPRQNLFVPGPLRGTVRATTPDKPAYTKRKT